ncbi:uncharacterized protein LOC144078968 [Stigmatopora argus]
MTNLHHLQNMDIELGARKQASKPPTFPHSILWDNMGVVTPIADAAALNSAHAQCLVFSNSHFHTDGRLARRGSRCSSSYLPTTRTPLRLHERRLGQTDQGPCPDSGGPGDLPKLPT